MLSERKRRRGKEEGDGCDARWSMVVMTAQKRGRRRSFPLVLVEPCG